MLNFAKSCIKFQSMEAVSDCIDEIALDGLSGCPIQQLWRHLEERKPPFPLELDDTAKQFLWKAIVGTPEVEFFVLTEPLAHLYESKCDDDIDKLKPTNPLDQYQGPLKESNAFKLICDEDLGIRGSCPSYFVRENVTQQIRGQEEYTSLETTYKRWGDCLVMVASQELRERALLGVHCDPNINIADIQYCLLEHVGQARYNGRMQRIMGSDFFKIESKSLFHYLKRLRNLRLITMQPVIITTIDSSKPAFSRNEGGRNFNTNVVRLRRFHVQEHHKYDLLAASLCKLLMQAPNQELSLAEIQKHVHESNKVLKKVRQYLQQAGYVVEGVMGETSEAAGSEEFSPPKKKKKERKESSVGTSADTIKVQLVKPFVLKSDSLWHPSDDGEGNDDDNDDDDGDDDGDDDREKDSWGDDYQSNLIAERPVETQVYDAIYQAGSRGCTLKKCQMACKLPFLDVRALLRILKKMNLVQEVHQDIAKTKIAWLVATPLVESNIQTMKVKQVQDQLKQMTMKAIESQTPDATPKGSPLHSPHPSPVFSEGLDVKEKKPKKRKSLIAERVTYRKLKRKQLILEYIQAMKVVEGYFPVQKAIILKEKEEGHEGKIDKKVVLRLFDDLNAQGLIRKLTTVVNYGTTSQTVDLFLHSSITNDDPKVAHALEQCRLRMREECCKAAERQEKARHVAEEKERKKLEKAQAAVEREKKKLENEEKEAQRKAHQEQGKEAAMNTTEPEQSAAANVENKVPSHKYTILPRFYRVQAMHELLWILLYGDITQQKTSGAADDSQMNTEMKESFDQNNEWMNHLKPLAKVCDENGQPRPGWFRFSDVLMVMPLSVLCQTIDMTERIEGFDEYASDPVKKNTLVGDLPNLLRRRVKECRRVKAAPMDLLCNMAQMGLITPCLPFPHIFLDVKMFLHKGVKLLDTTSSLPGYRTVCPPLDKPFQLRTHLFTSFAAIRSYWRDLSCVCLNTPLGLVRNQEESVDKMQFTLKDRRLVHFAKKEVDEDRVEMPPGDNLGAGGLDRSLFSHLQRNWTLWLTKSYMGGVQSKRKQPTTKVMVAEADAESAGSGQLPHSSEKRFLTLGRAETKKLAKKGREQRQKRKRKAEDLQGSKGVKKARTDTTEKPKNTKEKKSSQAHSCKTGHLTAVDDEDRNILARKANERISFSAEEDSWLLLFRIALGVMKHDMTQIHPYVWMRNILSKASASNFDKTAPSIKRRVLKLMKNPQSQMTVKICSAECAQDESFQGFDDPNAEFETTFNEVVKRLRRKFSSSSLSCDGDLPLVSSVKELHDKYKVQALVSSDSQIGLSDENILSLGPAIKSVSDITKAAIREQIQLAFTTPQELYDAYRVFHIFNSFTTKELQEVFKEMQNKNLVNRKKSIENTCAQFTRSLPFASLTYQLSNVYHRLFMQGLKVGTLSKNCANFWTQLVKGEQHTLQESSISDRSSSSSNASQQTDNLTPGTIEVKPKSIHGGHVACILALLATNKVSVNVCIPDEILNMNPSELPEPTEDIDTQQQPTQDAANAHADVQSTSVTSSDKTKEKSDFLSAFTDGRHPDNGQTTKKKASQKGAERSQLSSSSANGNNAVQSPSSTKGNVPIEKVEVRKTLSPKTKPLGKGNPGVALATVKEKKLEEREVFTLKLPSSVLTKFSSASDLTAEKESSNYLTSCIETVEVARSVSKVPVASLSHNSSSRSSRTTLILARGGKDPFRQIKQLPARAFNTHDFMTLYPCKNVLTIKDDSDRKLQSGKDLEDKSVQSCDSVSVTKRVAEKAAIAEKRIVKRIALSEDSFQSHTASEITRTSSLDSFCRDSVTCPVIVSTAVSLEDYLHQRKRELCFNEVDCVLARDIHGLVAEGEELGVPVTQLKEKINESHKRESISTQCSFEQHVNYLCAAKLLYKVGVCELRLVTASFVKPWCVALLKPKINSQEMPVKETTNQQGGRECNDLQQPNNGLEQTADIKEDTTNKASQTGLTSAQTTTEYGTSLSLDADATLREINEKAGQTGLSPQPEGDASSNEKEGSGGQRKKPKVSNYESYSAVCRPWITIDGTTSQQLLRMFKDMVLMLILNNPGFSESQIAKLVFEALRPVALHEILESLLLDGCIIRHTRKLPSRVSLFSASTKAESSQVMTFYTPSVDCLFKLATSKGTERT